MLIYSSIDSRGDSQQKDRVADATADDTGALCGSRKLPNFEDGGDTRLVKNTLGLAVD